MSDNNDDICDRCPRRGCCCYLEANVHDLRVVTDHACPFLDETSGRCTVYARRFATAWEAGFTCLSIEQMIKAGTVPKSCLYVVNKGEYQARVPGNGDANIRLYDFDIIPRDERRRR